MRLFLVARHGQSLFNVDKVVNGDPALDRGLSEQGIEEGARLAGQIAALPLDLVAVSPFPRALQTANIALAGREVPHLLDDDLGDVRIGDLEGKTLDAYREAPAHSNRKKCFPGGESLDEAALRYADACERLLARHEATTLVHTGVHTPYEKLAALPAALRARMRLVHYPDDFDLASSVIEPLHQGRSYDV